MGQTPPPFWQCQDFHCSYYCNPSLRYDLLPFVIHVLAPQNHFGIPKISDDDYKRDDDDSDDGDNDDNDSDDDCYSVLVGLGWPA